MQRRVAVLVDRVGIAARLLQGVQRLDRVDAGGGVHGRPPPTIGDVADDFVMAFEDARSGRRMLDVLGKRLGRYGLTLHETKTRYVDFRSKRPRSHDPDTTFDFLGFTHVWGRS